MYQRWKGGGGFPAGRPACLPAFTSYFLSPISSPSHIFYI